MLYEYDQLQFLGCVQDLQLSHIMETPKNPLFKQSYPYVRYKKFQMKYDNTQSVEYFIAPLYIISKIVNRSLFFLWIQKNISRTFDK